MISTIISWGNWCSWEQGKTIYQLIRELKSMIITSNWCMISSSISSVCSPVSGSISISWSDWNDGTCTGNEGWENNLQKENIFRWSHGTLQIISLQLTSLNILLWFFFWLVTEALNCVDLNDILVSIILLFKHFSNFSLVHQAIGDVDMEKVQLEGEKSALGKSPS